LQHKVSGKVVAVVGHATDFLLSLDVICELAGLDPKDLPFSRNEPRNLQKLLDPEGPLEELHGWEVVVEPAQIERLVPTGTCPICSLSVVNISAAFSPKRRRVEPVEPTIAMDRFVPPHASFGVGTLTNIAGCAGAAAADDEPTEFDPICELDRSRFQPMSEFSFATWRLGLASTLARRAVIEPEMLARLQDAWEMTRRVFKQARQGRVTDKGKEKVGSTWIWLAKLEASQPSRGSRHYIMPGGGGGE
jgi:hypothetical protein